MSTSAAQILLITGPAGIGKSTLTWALGDALAEARIAHAIIESDELDRVFPRPDAAQLDALAPGARDISQINLAALWDTYHALGHTRLIMSGIMLHVGFDKRWIQAAIPHAVITIVRLRASDETLTTRLDKREIGPGCDAQLERSRADGSAGFGRRRDRPDGRQFSCGTRGRHPRTHRMAEACASRYGLSGIAFPAIAPAAPL